MQVQGRTISTLLTDLTSWCHERKKNHNTLSDLCQSCSHRSHSSLLPLSHYVGHSVSFDSSCSCQKKTEWCFVSAHSKTLNLDRSLACQTPRQTNCVFPDSIIAVNLRSVSGRCDLAGCLSLSHFLCFPVLPSIEPCNCSCQAVALSCVLYLPLPWP